MDFSNLQAYDLEYVKSSIRSRIAESSIVILDKAESADLVLEVASGALGNEYKSTLIGIPSLPIPGSPVNSPDFHLWKKIEQNGIAKLLLTVYSDNKAIYSNHYYGKAERDETFFL